MTEKLGVIQEIELAIKAYHQVLEQRGDLQKAPNEVCCRLVIAGGYDKRVAENVEYWDELHELASNLGINQHVSTTC